MLSEYTLPQYTVKHAALLADYCLEVERGQRVLVQSSTLALPLVEALYRAILERGAEPILNLEYPDQGADYIRLANLNLLERVHPTRLSELESVHSSLRILTPHLGAAAPAERKQRFRLASHALTEIRRHKRWSLTLFPTQTGAELAEMPYADYADFVARAMFLDHPDPISKWLEVREFQAGLVERLSQTQEVRLVSSETDIKMCVNSRVWRNSDGLRNMPSGEVFTSPLEDSANGTIFFDVPTMYGGQKVSNIRLELVNGTITRASAEEGNDVLQSALETDPGARFLGEIGIGSNYGIQRCTREILFDEKMGGTVHLAVGSSYRECGGLNESAIHWDMICDLRGGGEIWLDGELFQRNGVFV